MFESMKIGRPFGINLYLHGTFWLLPAFVLLSGWAAGGLDAAVLDVAVLLTLFGCVALHELGHALSARWFGIRTKDIVLYPIGGVARLEKMPERPWQEIVVALAGPAVNVVIAALLVPLVAASNWVSPPVGFEADGVGAEATAFLGRVLIGNVILVAFNLIPAFPMDGGRVLRAVAAMVTSRERATSLAANLGAVFAVLFAVWGLTSGHLMLVVLAFFLFMAGRAELNSVRYEEAERRHQARYGDEVPVARVFGMPVARPVNEPTGRPADGWEYDPRRRLWVEWRDGYPVRFARPES